MRLTSLTCPRCAERFVVDTGLYEIGTVRVRCTACAHYFLPEGSPGSRTLEEVANSKVPLSVWEPDDERA